MTNLLCFLLGVIVATLSGLFVIRFIKKYDKEVHIGKLVVTKENLIYMSATCDVTKMPNGKIVKLTISRE